MVAAMRNENKKSAPRQSKLFIEKAREIGADSDIAADEVMRRLAGQPRRVAEDGKKPKTKKAAK